jgi:hypothetical protein
VLLSQPNQQCMRTALVSMCNRRGLMRLPRVMLRAIQ